MAGKSKGKGGKNRRRGKNDSENDRRELIFKEDGQEYAQVIKMLGSGRIEAFCFDGETRLCHIRGKLRKKVWINIGDIILIGLREFQDGRGDVILKYNADEARNLKSYGELPDSAKINETNFNGTNLDDDEIAFANNYSGSDESDDDGHVANAKYGDYGYPPMDSSSSEEVEEEENEEDAFIRNI